MALINPSSLYTAGNVRVDSSPSVNFYAKLQAEKQAKEDAIGEYVKGLNTKITPTGVRTQDLPAFQQMYNEWQNFGMNNLKEMARNPMLKAQFASKAQELMNFAEESKKAELEKKPIVDILTDPKKRESLSTSFMPMVQSHDEPLVIQDKSGKFIPNPNRKRIDYTSNIFNPPTIDVPKHFEGLVKGMEREEKVGEIVGKDPVTGRAIVSFTKGFSPSQIGSIASMAAKQFDADPSVKAYYQHRLDTMPLEEHKQLNDIYTSAFGAVKTKVRPDGKIIEEDFVGDDPRKLAMAEAIKYAKGLESSGTRAALDRELANQRSMTNIYLNKGNGDQISVQQSGNAFNDFENNDFGNFKVKDGAWYKKDGTPYNGDVFIKGEYIPSSIKSALKSGGIDPDALVGGVNAKIKDGVITSISNQIIGTVTRQSMEGVYQRKMDTERKNEPKLNFPNSNIKPEPKSKDKSVSKPKNDPLKLF